MRKSILIAVLVVLGLTLIPIVLAGCSGTPSETKEAKEEAKFRIVDALVDRQVQIVGVWYVDITAKVRNIGKTYGSCEILVKADGEISRSWPIFLQAKEEKLVTFQNVRLSTENSEVVVEVKGSRQIVLAVKQGAVSRAQEEPTTQEVKAAYILVDRETYDAPIKTQETIKILIGRNIGKEELKNLLLKV